MEYGERRILSDVYLICRTGEVTGIMGRNGEGKTTLMEIIYGTRAAQSSSVRFDGVSVFHPYKRKDRIRYLPQFHFIPAGLRLRRIFSDFGLDAREFVQHFPEYEMYMKSPLKILSGGQRRLVEVYVLLKAEAHFLLLDEPFSQLMPLHIEKVKTIIREEKKKKGIVITDHLYRQVIDVCDEIYTLGGGRLRRISEGGIVQHESLYL